MKVFIDFDDVIFNAKRFKEDLIRVFLKNGITRSEFENSYYTFQKRAQEWGQHYDPKKQILVLRKKNKIDSKKLNKDLDVFMSNLKGYVFSDAYDFMKVFSKKDLFLITYGHVKFQMKKIESSGVEKYFEKVLVTKNNKIDEIMKMCRKCKFPSEEKIILIDDRPEQLEKAEKEKKSILTFRLCRPEGRYSDLICADKDYEAKNLKEVEKILEKEGLVGA